MICILEFLIWAKPVIGGCNFLCQFEILCYLLRTTLLVCNEVQISLLHFEGLIFAITILFKFDIVPLLLNSITFLILLSIILLLIISLLFLVFNIDQDNVKLVFKNFLFYLFLIFVFLYCKFISVHHVFPLVIRVFTFHKISLLLIIGLLNIETLEFQVFFTKRFSFFILLHFVTLLVSKGDCIPNT